MVQFNLITDLSSEPITRQELFDMWANSELGTVEAADLADEVIGIIAADSAPSEAPGRIWADTLRQHHYVWTDEHNDTGVSLWLAIGPDRLETPCLAAEPIPPGALVELWFDRWVKVARPSEGALGDGVLRVIGANQSGIAYPLNGAASDTAASGTWLAVGIDGILSVFVEQGTTPPANSIPCGVGTNGAAVPADDKQTPNQNPVIGYATWNSSGASASDQPGGAHFFHIVSTSPKRTQGPFV